MKPIILAIIGPSGSGKTTIADYLGVMWDYNVIVSYTTRPIRDDESNGKEHWFVTENEMPPRKDMLAYTCFGGYHYWADRRQLMLDIPNVYVIDEKGLLRMMEEFDDIYDIRTVSVVRDRNLIEGQVDKKRMARDKGRIQIDPETCEGVIVNNGTMAELHDQIYDVIAKVMNER